MHVLMEHADDRGRVDIRDVVVYTAESLDELAQGLSFLLDEQMEIARLAMRFVAACKGAGKLMAQVCPGGYGVVRQMHEPGPDVGLEYQREVVGKDLVVPPPGSLHHNGVDAEELRWMRLAVVLLWYVWLEILRAGPLDLPQLTGKRRAAYRVRQVAWFPWCLHVERGLSALVRLTPRFSSALDASPSVFFLPFVKNLALVASSSRIRRRSGVVVVMGPASR